MAVFSLSASARLPVGSYYVATLIKGTGTAVPYTAAGDAPQFRVGRPGRKQRGAVFA
ncbi:hypothetical protein [Streptomyces sp. x-80]|uniref:hypothetical protein n=1 Tax=Streptomyces sp. x-80 TaxID=2789282 RepID=UPI00397F0D55